MTQATPNADYACPYGQHKEEESCPNRLRFSEKRQQGWRGIAVRHPDGRIVSVWRGPEHIDSSGASGA